MQAQAGRISHYRVLGELGRDRLGYVLRAKDEQLDRPVVLRVVRAASVVAPDRVDEVRATFQRNAKRAARVGHPNLVTIYAFESIGDVDLIAMELVEGASLRAMLALGDRWRIPDAAGLVARVADAVAAAHAANLTHGSLSLANVVVRPDGRVKVLDLGVPKLADGAEPEGEDAAPDLALLRSADRPADVRGLALIALELATSALRPPGALWRPVNAAAEDPATAVAEPGLARSRFGGLAPTLRRAFSPAEGEAFRDAVEFRDALLDAIREPDRQAKAPRASLDEPVRPGPPVVAPRIAVVAAGAGAALDLGAADSAEAARRPRLVLPADLAAGRSAPPGGTFVVMGNDSLGARWRVVAETVRARLGRRLGALGTSAMIVSIIALVLIFAGLVAAKRYFASGDASAATVAADQAADSSPAPVPGPGPSAAPPSPQPAPVITPPPPAAPSARRAAMVRASPVGTTIRISDRDDVWMDGVELDVADGDSLLINFARLGYVSQTRVFRGSRLAVALRPDSVQAFFTANLPAQVFLVNASGRERLLGTTDFTVRLPSGLHHILFRAAGQTDWFTSQRMPAAGASYRVVKSDYIAEGSLQATVSPTWAWISVDGGPNRDSPLRVDRLSVGRHTIRVTRAGFATIEDTVMIRPGQVLTRRYTLRPR